MRAIPKSFYGAGVILFSVVALFLLIYVWSAVRFYVPEGHSLMLRYKGPVFFGSRDPAEAGQFAKDGEVGVLSDLPGPGRHWYWTLWWERKLVPDVVVKPGQVAVVTSRMGEPLPTGEFLVDGDLGNTNQKGILRKVFGPGRYRVHPYQYKFRIIETEIEQRGNQTSHSGWVEIPTGYVGVVTNKADNPLTGQKKGIQDDVLPPGVYPVNPREQRIDIVEIGFRETSIVVTKQTTGRGQVAHDESGEPLAVAQSGINFPSNDGFDIQLDFTAVWGVMPEQAPQVVRTFGNIEAVEQKVILPQSESICRNNGSKMGAVELLVGDTRSQFQIDTSSEFQEILKEKGLTLLYGLIRHIYIPQEVRVPIQNGYIADELTLTREEERTTAKTEADLREAEKKVELEAERIRIETAKLVANVMAEGEKEAKQIDAEAKQLVAQVDKQIAVLDAKQQVVLGQANAEADKLSQEARSQKFQLAVEAFGSGDAFSKWQFAEGLPTTIDLKMLYAGEGTLWTDLKGVLPTLPVKNAGTKRSTR